MRVSDSTACFSFTFSLPHPPTTDQWSHPLSLDSARDPPFKSHLPSPFILAIWIIDAMERINHGNLQFLHITGNWFPTDQFDFKCFERRAQQQQVCRGGSERLATCCPVVATILFFVHNYISSSRKHNFSWAKSPPPANKIMVMLSNSGHHPYFYAHNLLPFTLHAQCTLNIMRCF